MKKMILALLSIGFVFSACEKDDSTQQIKTLEERILGEWKWVKFEDFHEPDNVPADVHQTLPDGALVTFTDSQSDNAIFFRNDGGSGETHTWKKINEHVFTLSNYATVSQKVVSSSYSPELVSGSQGSRILTFQSKVYEGAGKFHIIRYTLVKSTTP